MSRVSSVFGASLARKAVRLRRGHYCSSAEDRAEGATALVSDLIPQEVGERALTCRYTEPGPQNRLKYLWCFGEAGYGALHTLEKVCFDKFTPIKSDTVRRLNDDSNVRVIESGKERGFGFGKTQMGQQARGGETPFHQLSVSRAAAGPIAA
jgi:hypothetical protein